MILFEFEGKELLKKYGVEVPESQLLSSSDDQIKITPPFVIKAQVMSGKRKTAGGIIEVDGANDFQKKLNQVLGKVINKEKVEKVLLEKKIGFNSEYYISVSYDTNTRGPIVTFSESGGTGVEERKSLFFPVDILTSKINYGKVKINDNIKDFIDKLLNLFLSEDASLVEINPAVITDDGNVMALDAKIKLDDTARGRHADRNYSPRNIPGHAPTKQEISAKKIDENDYRGTAGSAYFDLPGDIAVLSSGGGVSLTALDALTRNGGKPSNFTEYSGNPPKEKVVKLTKIVLDKPDIHGLWVIGTVVANFTDIYETLSGLIEGLGEAEKELKTKFDFPIVIRRGGPRDKEAFEMLRKVKDFNLTLEGPETSIEESAKVMAQKAKDYAKNKKTA